MRRDEIMERTFNPIIMYIVSCEKLEENEMNFNVLKLYSQFDWPPRKMP